MTLSTPVLPGTEVSPSTAGAIDVGAVYQTLLRIAPFSLIVLDPELRVVSASLNFIEQSRRTEEETIGKLLRDVFLDVVLSFTHLESNIRSVFESGRSLPGAQLTYRATGMPVRIYVYTVTPVKTGPIVTQVMLVMDDITEQLHLSANIRLTERKLAGVVQRTSDLIISVDPDGCITGWSPAAERISGYRSGVVCGQLLAGLCEATRDKDMGAIIRQIVEGGVAEFFSEINLIGLSGDLIPVDWSFSPVRDDSGKVTSIVAVGRDLVERRTLEQHLYQSEKLAALGVMAGGIAHELRNPLSVSFSAAQFLLDPIDDPSFHRECVGKILQGIERSSAIVENLLRFARPSVGNQTDCVNLVTVVRETLSVLASQGRLQRINLSEHYEEALLAVSGNANLLQQVIMNLVLNAYQSMSQGGDVSVFTRRESDMAAVYVRDTGCGISQVHMERIFDPFFTTRPAGQGTGLGLSICHTIVKQHGGVIAVESSIEGQGSTFVVRLPLLENT